MFVLMACALMMAVAIHYAFGYRAWLFAIAYVAMALIRAFYMARVMRGTQMGQNYWQLGIWSCPVRRVLDCRRGRSNPCACRSGSSPC